MLFATFLGVLLIPVFYVVVRRLLGDKLDGDAPPAGDARTGTPAHVRFGSAARGVTL